MPELPEVESVRRGLATLLVGKTVTAVHTNWEKVLVGGLDAFNQALTGQTVTAIDRRGKYLLIRFSNATTLISHLRMEGKYQVVAASEPMHRFVHVWFDLDDGAQLRYHDMRKFGRMQLVATGTEMQVGGLATIGPEPNPESFTVADFEAKLARHHKAIKSVLLDQSTVAGIGNIYADESLWRAQIHPETPADQLSHEEAVKLHDVVIDLLAQAITLGGTSVHTFVDATGKRGGFQNELKVYGRTGEPCERCGTAIQKIKVGQRGTHFCPHCQVRKD